METDKDRTLSIEFITLPDGTLVTKNYDKNGKPTINQTNKEDEIREFVKSAELLSKKGSKRRLSLLQKQRGE